MNQKDNKKQRRIEGNNRVRRVMKDRGMTVEQVAKEMGFSVSTANQYLSPGGRDAPLELVMKFCLKYDVAMSWLLFGFGLEKMSEVRQWSEVMGRFENMLHRGEVAIKKVEKFMEESEIPP